MVVLCGPRRHALRGGGNVGVQYACAAHYVVGFGLLHGFFVLSHHLVPVTLDVQHHQGYGREGGQQSDPRSRKERDQRFIEAYHCTIHARYDGHHAIQHLSQGHPPLNGRSQQHARAHALQRGGNANQRGNNDPRHQELRNQPQKAQRFKAQRSLRDVEPTVNLWVINPYGHEVEEKGK